MIKIKIIIIFLLICFQLQAQKFEIIYEQPEISKIDSIEKRYHHTKNNYEHFYLSPLFTKNHKVSKLYDTVVFQCKYASNDSNYHINYYYKKNEKKISLIIFHFDYDSAYIGSTKNTYRLIKEDVSKNLDTRPTFNKESTKRTKNKYDRKKKIENYIIATEWKKNNLHVKLNYNETLKNNSDYYRSNYGITLMVWWD